ncbi:MAG: DNA polymerase II large subunit [Candidatus Hodarchaeota archaeon]
MKYQEAYLASLREQAHALEEVAKAARSKGLDPTRDVEMRPAEDVAGRVEGLVGPEGVAERIRELSETEPTHSVALEIAREIVQSATVEGWNPEKAAEQAIRTALAILTEGITAGPIEGIANVKIKTNVDGSRYLAVFFAGPIRAAGGTEAAQTVVIADAVRQQLDLDRYKPSLENIERYVEEIDLYNRVSHLQYPSKPEEVRLAARSIPVEVTGEPTAEVEVTGYRDIPGVETNRLRGGAILVLNDSVLGKAHKLANLVEQLNLPGWEWLDNLAPRESDETEVEQRIQPKEKYLEDIIAGRPVLAYPSRRGGFRIRYGRSRNTGLAALGVHPATMILLDNFIACGTQLIIERPGKACVALPVDSIHGPIVKLKNGSILRVNSVNEAKKIRQSVEKILFLGDLLVGYGEFRENNHLLVPAGYCPEWWAQEALLDLRSVTPDKRKKLFASIDNQTLSRLLHLPLQFYPDSWQALMISELLGVPLHPRYLYFWEDLSPSQLRLFCQWVRQLEPEYEGDRVTALHGTVTDDITPILETLCIPCHLNNTHIRFTESAPILFALFLGESQCDFTSLIDDTEDVINYLQKHWPVFLHPKGTFYIGARIGRPEKARRRTMSPPPHGIFPIGTAGGPMRDIRKAGNRIRVPIEANVRLCPQCNELQFLRKCPECDQETEQIFWCPVCNQQKKSYKCEVCETETNTYAPIKLPIKSYLDKARNQLGGRLPGRVKGVKGLMSQDKVPEILEKAILRARYDLFVYKDGTVRFDMTDAPLTHFKPSEIQVSPDQLKALGYHFDIDGAPLRNGSQILELKTQDIVIPYDCAKYLYRISKFIDDLLVQVYLLEPFYQLKSPENLVGQLIVGLAPHTSAGIIGRIIGFTPLRVCYAHPFWHAAKRRNADGDEDSVLLALDPMINFSRAYLPASRGGTMDTPLVLSVTISPKEIDDEAHNIDGSGLYPLEFYQRTMQFVDPKDVEDIFDLVAHRVVDHRIEPTAESYGLRFSHDTSGINNGPRVTTYTKLKTMEEKVERQLALGRLIAAVDVQDMAQRLLDSHFLPDIFGNIRAFSTQKFRCTGCNEKFRRIPLLGVCPECSGKLVLTVTKAGITKYIDLAARIVQDFQLPHYYQQRLDLATKVIDSLFPPEETKKQITLKQFSPASK